jgi:methyl-accepting chemotaxis protein
MTNWTFGRKIAVGFALSVVALLIVGAVSYRSTNLLIETQHQVAHTHLVLENLEGLLSGMKDSETGERGFVIAGEEPFLEPYHAAQETVARAVKELRSLTADNPNQQRRLDAAELLIRDKNTEVRQIIDFRRSRGFEAAQAEVKTGAGKRSMDELRRVLADMTQEENDLLKQRTDAAEASAAGVRSTILVGTLLSLILVALAGFSITRSLNKQLGDAIQHIQSSSSELQAAATQQATGAKEQASATQEVTTTIKELLATARQIVESAQRVARIAEETAGAAKSGDAVVQRAQESTAAIKRQVELIVAHMLDLGKKSQQIGAILEIINELAEQTNILAINATIESAGAGDAGRRFGVVADEIRKLADRVGGSSREIRGLIDEIRAAANTTVMATEDGSKAVESGAQKFAEVTLGFKHIAGMVQTTTEAAREIELSTKQQSSAVEQVNVAMGNVAQSARETEATMKQTLDTASQLAHLSRGLAQLIRAE